MITPTSAVSRPDLRDQVYEEWDLDGQRQQYIANALFPFLEVPHAAAVYKKFKREAALEDSEDLRKSDGNYNMATMDFTEDNYGTDEHALAMLVDQNTAQQTKEWFDAEVVATENVLGRLHRRHEIDAATKAGLTANYGANGAVITPWSNHEEATPVEDVKLKGIQVEETCGRFPNVLALTRTAYEHLSMCFQIQDLLKHDGFNDMKSLPVSAVAKAVGVQSIAIAGGLKNTAGKNKEASLSRIWDSTKASLVFVSPKPSLRTLSWGCTYHWKGDGSEENFRVEQYWDDNTRSWKIRARRQVRLHVREPKAGYLFTGVIA